MTETPDSEAVPVGDGWFDQWLETGTVSQRSVDVYGRPDLLAEYEQLDRRYKIAAEEEKSGGALERDLTEESEATRILAEMRALYKKWMDSKTTWFIRALSDDEIDEVRKPIEDLPDLDEKATDEEKHERAELVSRLGDESDIKAVCKALVKIENHQGQVVKTSITFDQMTALARKFGKLQVRRLVAAALVAATQEPSMPVPLSRTNSKSAPSS